MSISNKLEFMPVRLQFYLDSSLVGDGLEKMYVGLSIFIWECMLLVPRQIWVYDKLNINSFFLKAIDVIIFGYLGHQC